MTDDDMSEEAILQRMLSKIPDTIDKREGSIIYDALAPASKELAIIYLELKYNIDLIFADTAVEEYLDRLCNQIGITRKEATPAIKQGDFYNVDEELIDVNIGRRYTCEDTYWKVIEKISTGVYQLQCETAGTIGNNSVGSLVPVDYINNLGTATLTELLVPGEDEETDEKLRERYFANSNNNAFGGNIENYKEMTKALDGVGAVKVIPIWNGGGTVKLIILNSDYDIASDVLVKKIQDTICPDESYKGIGLAPIGHKVTVTTVQQKDVNISTNIVLSSGAELETVKNLIKEAIQKYLLEIRKTWEDNNILTVRISQIEALILNVEGVLDIYNTAINGQNSNIEIEQEYIPILGTLEVLNGGAS